MIEAAINYADESREFLFRYLPKDTKLNDYGVAWRPFA
jgi:hypothetical protein